VYDAAGRAYLGFFGGIVTISVGHCNDQVTATAIVEPTASLRMRYIQISLPNAGQANLSVNCDYTVAGRMGHHPND
jgi:acetylornithine/succinyldiaminopimelate/putrescine aminotransferase